MSERLDQGDRIKKYRTSWKRVEYLAGNKLNDGSLFKTTLSLKSEKYRSVKK